MRTGKMDFLWASRKHPFNLTPQLTSLDQLCPTAVDVTSDCGPVTDTPATFCITNVYIAKTRVSRTVKQHS
jgi:hypothetical protein